MMRYVYVPYMDQIPQWKQCYYDHKTLSIIQNFLYRCETRHNFYSNVLRTQADLLVDHAQYDHSQRNFEMEMESGRSEKFSALSDCRTKQYEIMSKWCENFTVYSYMCSKMVSAFVKMKGFQLRDKFQEYQKFIIIVKDKRKKMLMLLQNLYIEGQYLQKALSYNIAQQKMITTKYQGFSLKYDEHRKKFDENKKLRRWRKINEELLGKIQQIYILQCQQRQQYAYNILQALNLKDTNPGYLRQKLIGAVMGAILMMTTVLIFTDQSNNFKIEGTNNFTNHFPIWRGASYILFYLWLLGLDVLFYERSQINYRLIFQFKHHNMPESRFIFLRVSILSVIYLVLFYLFSLEIAGKMKGDFLHYGAVFWAFLIVQTVVIAPINQIKSKHGRFFFFKLLIRVILTPCVTINFVIIWFTEQMSSFNQPFGDFFYTVCFVATNDASYCTRRSPFASTGYILAIFLYRMIQNLKLWHQITMQKPDKKYDFKAPQFLGFFRGLFAFITAMFALFDRLKLFEGSFVVWLVCSIITTLYSQFIDIRFDWGILKFGSRYCLRQKLLFPKAKGVYYFFSFFNLVLRTAWILNISSLVIITPGFSSMLFVMMLSYLEIFRRGVWNILRIQNQHVRNCGEFRATITDQQILQEVRTAYKEKQQKIRLAAEKLEKQKGLADPKARLKRKLTLDLSEINKQAEVTAKLSALRMKETKQMFRDRLQELAEKKAYLLQQLQKDEQRIKSLDRKVKKHTFVERILSSHKL